MFMCLIQISLRGQFPPDHEVLRAVNCASDDEFSSVNVNKWHLTLGISGYCTKICLDKELGFSFPSRQ